MPTITKSFYAARGDQALHGVNTFLEDLALPKEDFVELLSSRSRDGMWLTLTYRERSSLRMDFASVGPGAWFQQGTLPPEMALGFNTAIAEPLTDGQFKWVWSTNEEDVLSANVVVTEEGRFLQFPLPSTLSAAYTGPLTLVGLDLQSAAGEGMEEALGITATVTGEDEKLPQQGNPAYSRALMTGRMQLARITASPGQSVDDLIKQYLVQQELQEDQIIRVLQNRAPNDATDILILWWRGTAPRVSQIAPANQSTISVDTLPSQIFLQFDQGVPYHFLDGSDGEDRILFDGVPYDQTGILLHQVDSAGSQYLLKNIPLTTGSVGNHTLMVRPVPNQYGDLPSPPMLFSWQVLDVEATAAGAPPAGSWVCEELGVGDGINMDFFMTDQPVGCPTQIYLNGLFQAPDCYTVIGNQLTFGTPPFDGSVVWAYYKA